MGWVMDVIKTTQRPPIQYVYLRNRTRSRSHVLKYQAAFTRSPFAAAALTSNIHPTDEYLYVEQRRNLQIPKDPHYSMPVAVLKSGIPFRFTYTDRWIIFVLFTISKGLDTNALRVTSSGRQMTNTPTHTYSHSKPSFFPNSNKLILTIVFPIHYTVVQPPQLRYPFTLFRC